mmetsp:Transcript_39995/g.94935  ORF Transcript_39995/g.94935 Transcript_39995/m.94935 type:complete len:260 (-) Transcript_39995:1313-2092(-)
MGEGGQRGRSRRPGCQGSAHLQLLLFLDQLLHCCYMPFDLGKLQVRVVGRRCIVCFGSEDVGSDLALDEELRQSLRELDLLGQALRRQVEHALEQRLDLDHADSEEGRLELHRPPRLAKLPLLIRQRLDRILELLRRRDGAQLQRDLECVLVLDDHGMLGFEGVGRHNLAYQNNEAAQLSCLCAKLRLRHPVSAEAVHQPRVQHPIPFELHARRRVNCELHRRVRLVRAHVREHWLAHCVLRASVSSFDGQQSFGAVHW